MQTQPAIKCLIDVKICEKLEFAIMYILCT
jgi:hypothetical protein